jgi:preprotein translocase subunit YajC
MYLFAYAQTTNTPGVPQSNPLSGLIPLILIFIVFYLLLIRPQQKKEKEHKKMISELKKDDYVLTSGGIYGTITNVKPDTIELKVDENTKLTLAKNAVIQVLQKPISNQ